MDTRSTKRCYLDDSYLRSCRSEVIADDEGWWALAETVFYPGGGGQPADRGTVGVDGDALPILGVRKDHDHVVWHQVGHSIPVGTAVRCEIDWAYRYALMRHHALMHVVNTIAHRSYGGLITGTQLGPDRSRIDFCFTSFDRARLSEFEASVNEAIGRDLAITSSEIGEKAFAARPDLIRTLNVAPPVEGGMVRVVEIGGFDTQACGGTHVHSTQEIGTARIDGFENKGRENKRLYWVLER